MKNHYYLFLILVLLLLQKNIVYAATDSCDKRALLNNLIEEHVDRKDIPSIAFQAEDELGIIYVGAKGQKSFEDGSAINRDSYFRTASIAKLFTAISILKLMEEEKLKLEDTIDKYLPKSLVNRLHTYQGQNYGPSITLFHLLSHTSGLPNADDNPAFMESLLSNPNEAKTPKELLEYAISIGAKFPPGTKQEYSSAGYMLLGLIIEAVTDKKYHEVVREHILDPLGLIHTFEETHEKPDNINILSSYVGNLDITQLHPSMEFADGGFITTTADLIKFGLALNDGQLFKKPSTFEMMLKPNGEKSIGLSAFVGIENNKPVCFFHVGFWGTILYVDIKTKLAIAYTLNQAHIDSSVFLARILKVMLQEPSSYKDSLLYTPCLKIHPDKEPSIVYGINDGY